MESVMHRLKTSVCAKAVEEINTASEMKSLRMLNYCFWGFV